MENEIKFKIKISAILSEVERRCQELTHPVPDDTHEVAEKMEGMAGILIRAFRAIYGMEGDLDDVIHMIQTKKYGEEKNEEAGEA